MSCNEKSWQWAGTDPIPSKQYHLIQLSKGHFPSASLCRQESQVLEELVVDQAE